MKEIPKKKNERVIKSNDEIIREMESLIGIFAIIVLLLLCVIIYYIGKEQLNEQSTHKESTNISNIIG